MAMTIDAAEDAAAEEFERGQMLEDEKPAPPPAEKAMSGAVSIIKQTQAHVNTVTEFIVHSMELLEAKLHDIKEEALADCERMKKELEGHVMSAEALVRQVEDIGKLAEDIRVRRTALMNGTR